MRSIAVAAAIVLAMPAAAAEHVVIMQQQSYVPANLTAAEGDTIRFVNAGETDHEVFVPTVGFGIDLGKQEPGQETVLNLARPGAFEVECVFHADMLLTVAVK
jgi:plastocyanin